VKNEFCDFCSSQELDGAKTYACEPFTLGGIEYADGWDACTECAALIDRDDWNALYERTDVARGLLPGWKLLPEGAKRAGEDSVRRLHAEFRRRRLKSN
jgi:hypothetical protein